MAFNETLFASHMAQGVGLQAVGEHRLALDVRLEAHGMAPEGSLEQGRAARDVSASYDKLDDLGAAGPWAQKAYQIHDRLVETAGADVQATIAAARERSVSAMYVGINGLRRYAHGRRDGKTHEQLQEQADSAVIMMRLTWSDLCAVRELSGRRQPVDQYEINAARRVSVAESLFGSHGKGLRIAGRAVLIALRSESRSLPTSSSEMSTRSRLVAKRNAMIGGLAAVAVGLTAWGDTLRRHVALPIAERFVLGSRRTS